MPRNFALLFILAAVAACDQFAKSTPNQVPASAPAGAAATVVSGRDSAPGQGEIMPTSSTEHEETESEETYGSRDSTPDQFASDDAKNARGALEAQLALDQFLSSETHRPYGTTCATPEVNPRNPYDQTDLRVAFVRPRIIDASFQMSSLPIRLWILKAEITRLAVLKRDANGKWRGTLNLTRDTLEYFLNTRDTTGKWTVCGMPGHSNGYNRDGTQKPNSPWLPVNAGDAAGLKPTWDGNVTWTTVMGLADSVSKLPIDAVVEGNPEPTVPRYIRDVCPGEGCSFGEWLTCDTIRVLAEAKVGAPTAFILNRGDKFTAVTGDVHIRQAGKVVFKRKVTIKEEGMNATFTPADTLYPLLYEGEGFGSWYFRGKEGGGYFFFGDGTPEDRGDDPAGYAVVRPLESDWWVKARANDGKEGWFIPSGSIFGMAPHYEEMPKKCPAAQ